MRCDAVRICDSQGELSVVTSSRLSTGTEHRTPTFLNTSGEKLSGILGLHPGIQQKRKSLPTMSDLVHVYPGIDVRQHAVDDQWQRQLRWFTRQLPRSRESFAGITSTNSQRDADSNIVHIFDSSFPLGPDRRHCKRTSILLGQNIEVAIQDMLSSKASRCCDHAI
jgi:hypothetical protein